MYTWRAFSFVHLELLVSVPFKVKNWVQYYADLVGITPGKRTIFHLRHKPISILVRPNTTDRAIFTTVAVQDEYRIKKLVANNNIDTVLDLGGQIGVFSTMIAPHCRQVYTYEPHPTNFSMLQMNIAINEAKNVTPIQRAVVSSVNPQKKLVLYEDASNTGGHTLLATKKCKKIPIITVSLQDAIKLVGPHTIDLMKIDIEGYEYDLILNTPPQAFSKVRRIYLEYVEYSKKKNSVSLVKKLEKMGYSVEKTHNIIFAER